MSDSVMIPAPAGEEAEKMQVYFEPLIRLARQQEERRAKADATHDERMEKRCMRAVGAARPFFEFRAG